MRTILLILEWQRLHLRFVESFYFLGVQLCAMLIAGKATRLESELSRVSAFI
jgi:hypothetical protein